MQHQHRFRDTPSPRVRREQDLDQAGDARPEGEESPPVRLGLTAPWMIGVGRLWDARPAGDLQK